MTTTQTRLAPTCGGGAAGREPCDPDDARLRGEFLSMPALSLTPEQTARLLDVPVASAVRILTALEVDGFLTRTPNGRYRLAALATC